MSSFTPQLKFDDLLVDLNRQQVRRGRRKIEVSGISFRLLDALVRKFPDTLTRKELTEDVWGSMIVSDATLRQRVRILRQELGSARYIENVKGIGYRAGEPVEEIAQRSIQFRPWLVAVAIVAMILSVAYLGIQIFPEASHAIIHRIVH